MSENINETTGHLRFCYISIIKNLLPTETETKSVKTGGEFKSINSSDIVYP